jgi:hypothetical protein
MELPSFVDVTMRVRAGIREKNQLIRYEYNLKFEFGTGSEQITPSPCHGMGPQDVRNFHAIR